MAEIGAAFLCVKGGVTAEPREDHAQYLKSWIGVIGVVTIAGDDHGALVRLASTGALVKDTGAEMTMHNQSRVRMKLELLERQQHRPAMENVKVD